MDCGIKAPLQNLGGFDGVIHAEKGKIRWCSFSQCGFKTEILKSGASGLQSPQIDSQKPGARHDRFLSRGSARRCFVTEHVGEFLKTSPGRIPFLQSPHCFPILSNETNRGRRREPSAFRGIWHICHLLTWPQSCFDFKIVGKDLIKGEIND